MTRPDAASRVSLIAIGRFVTMAAFSMIATARASAASAPAPTWAGDIDGSMAFYLTPGCSTLMSTFAGLTLMIGGVGKGNLPPQIETKTVAHDSSTGGLHGVGHTTIKSTYSISGCRVDVDVEVTEMISFTHTDTGAAVGRQLMTGRAHFDVIVCPDANGISAGHISVALQQECTKADGSRAGCAATVEGPFRLINGDDAHLVQTELDLQYTAGCHRAPGPNSSFEANDWGLSVPVAIVTPRHGVTTAVPGGPDTWRSNGTISEDALKKVMADDIERLCVDRLSIEAEKVWRSGACVKLETDARSRKVASREKVTFTVDAVHQFDHQPVKAPIQAQLTGVASLEPNATPVDPPARFEYVAGTRGLASGSIALKQTGKRGIGATTLEFTVNAEDLNLTFDGTYKVKVAAMKNDLRLSIDALRLECRPDGIHRGSGTMNVKGKISFGNFRGPVNGTTRVDVVAEFDEADANLVRLEITPNEEEFPIDISNPDFRARGTGPLALDVWGQLVSNQPITIGKATVIKESIATFGVMGMNGTTVTKISVSKMPAAAR